MSVPGGARLKTCRIVAGRITAACGFAALVLLFGARGLQNAIAEGDTRTISLHHVHTGEDITITFKREGRYDEAALEKLNWFLRDFGYDMELLTQDQMDEKALVNLRGVVRTTHVTLKGQTFQNLEAFAPAAEWEELAHAEVSEKQAQA